MSLKLDLITCNLIVLVGLLIYALVKMIFGTKRTADYEQRRVYLDWLLDQDDETSLRISRQITIEEIDLEEFVDREAKRYAEDPEGYEI